jgi:hypothetical protein
MLGVIGLRSSQNVLTRQNTHKANSRMQISPLTTPMYEKPAYASNKSRKEKERCFEVGYEPPQLVITI